MIDGGDGGDASDVTVDVDVPADDRDTDDGDTFIVADSDEYNQSRRLKAIHQARADVRKAHRELTYISDDGYDVHYDSRQQLASRVAFYGSELRPLMEEVGWSHEFPDGFPWDTLDDFLRNRGRLPKEVAEERADNDVHEDLAIVSETESMEAFRVLNKFAREAGLGVDLEGSADEWEV